MELSGSLFHVAWLWWFGAIYIPALLLALKWGRWRQLLQDSSRQHLFFGSIVLLYALWHLRVEMLPGFYWHLSGMVIITLMFGWSRALVIGSLALLCIVLTGLNDWAGLLPSLVLCVLLPASLTQVVLGISRAYAPKHFFVYVLVDAFLAGAVIFLLMAGLISGGLLLMGSYSWAELKHNFFSLAPMMMFPEAMFNGWITALLVAFKPDWISSFNDEEYLHGK